MFNVLFSHSQCFQMMLFCCAHQTSENEEAFSKGRLLVLNFYKPCCLFCPCVFSKVLSYPYIPWSVSDSCELSKDS